ncbi:MAG: DegT/DnrJ/EryC1/StrS family aminotransferase [Candidatus Omnitrophota bacterium]|nr:DegT/DnrJ/EryC1/StrS family aminotransferase [Candidatus Omnitrophota bacterium]MDZ4241558.1 DegT/DnrJ/EryC1/StrS family aminotransferase [Candidatus Omnitrophota bacterium]
MPIPMLDLKREYEFMKADIDAAIRKCLDHQKWILGPEVKELEEKAAAYLETKHCIGASSGTDALVLALRALAIKRKGEEYFTRNDKIITTPFTFTATGDAILRSGATPVFVDIHPKTFNIDPVLVSRCLKEMPGVVGIIPVHLYGRSCEMDAIMDIARQHNLFVIEDVAQAFGASWNGKKAGTIGDCGAYSFFPSKNLGGFGDGGMVSTNDPGLADLVRMLLKHGGKDKYNVDHIGYNARLDTLQAAVLAAKLKHIDHFNNQRRAIADSYSKAIAGATGIVTPQSVPGHVFHQYTIRVEGGRRDALQKILKEAGVDTMIYYPVTLNKMKVFAARSETFNGLPEAERAVSEVLSLPIEPLFSAPEIQLIYETVKKSAAQ